MKFDPMPRFGSASLSACVLFGALATLQSPTAVAQGTAPQTADVQQSQIDEQTRKLEELKRTLQEQEATLRELQRAVGQDVLATQRGGSSGAQVAQASSPPAAGSSQQAADSEGRPREVAPIFEQPGVLTPKNKFVFEPSLQYSYSSSNRVALVGYTIIPAILIGVVDVREVKRNTFTAAVTGRYGLTNRLEVEARLPFVYRSDTSVGRELGQGAATNTAFEATGKNVGDFEATARYQLNDGGADKPYFVGSLRFKSRTGRDPFEVETSNSIVGLREGVQTQLPTGSGFYGVQPALTALFPSDPAVFFGTVSYLHSIKRTDVTRQTDTGPQNLGTIEPGGVFGFNFGMGLALNEKSSFSIGYDHSSVGKTKQNGVTSADSVRVQLGTLLLGYSYRLSPKQTLNVSLGAGLTRDTPDVTLSLRIPFSQ